MGVSSDAMIAWGLDLGEVHNFPPALVEYKKALEDSLGEYIYWGNIVSIIQDTTELSWEERKEKALEFPVAFKKYQGSSYYVIMEKVVNE